MPVNLRWPVELSERYRRLGAIRAMRSALLGGSVEDEQRLHGLRPNTLLGVRRK
jgi:hypothetical protein